VVTAYQKVAAQVIFYVKMRLDGRRYSKILCKERLPYTVFSGVNALYNPATGFDMLYQENKVHNLKVLSAKFNGLILRPGETFSFWQAARRADRHVPYKDGLILKGGELTIGPAGGLCQMSNLLYWVFLHSPLVAVERHTHHVKNFATPCGMPEGVDATISEGWLDLKFNNPTDTTYQIAIDFTDDTITCTLLADTPHTTIYEIKSTDVEYIEQDGKVYQHANVYRNKEFLYKNICQMGYTHEEA